jgi:LuxR family transcriptional regulator, maltose regulon positive regulatory protein
VPHALAASDGEQAARLIEQVARPIALCGQVETVLGWLNALPDALIRARPRLCLYYADLLRLTSQPEAAEMRLQEAERSLEQLASPAQRREVEGGAAALRSIIARSAGDLSRCVALANQALALFAEEGLAWRALAQVDAAHVFLMNGDVTPLMEQQVMAAIDPAKASGDLAPSQSPRHLRACPHDGCARGLHPPLCR